MKTIIVGAGVFGAATALELRGRGHDVTLLDPGPLPHPDASSTDVSKMVRMDYGSDVFYHELAEAALDGWDRWNADWSRPLYHETGFLVLSARAMESGGFEHESWQVLRARGYDPPRVAPTDLGKRWPAWRLGAYQDGYLSERGGWAESGAVVERLLALGRDAGVRQRPGRLGRLVESGRRVQGVTCVDGAMLTADLVVLCTGAWTPDILPRLESVMWSTGQPVVHLLPTRAERFRGEAFPPFAADIAGSGWYGFPALEDGRVKIAHHAAGRRIPADRRGSVGAEHVERTRAFLRDAIPALAEAPLAFERVCMYCDTFDGDLWIDHDPDREGLMVAAGGSGHAFKFAPLLGPIIADVAERVENRWADRFRWRERVATRTEEARFEGA